MSTVIDGSASVTINSGVILGITSGTAVPSTSGTSIDFTSIPSWVKRITVMFNGVSTSGTSNWLLQLGSGSVTTTGYLSVSARLTNAVAVATTSYTTGLGIFNDSAAAVVGGICTFTLLGSNAWTATAVLSRTDSVSIYTSGMTIALGGTLDRVRITTVGGTDTFDAGSINILYEG